MRVYVLPPFVSPVASGRAVEAAEGHVDDGLIPEKAANFCSFRTVPTGGRLHANEVLTSRTRMRYSAHRCRRRSRRATERSHATSMPAGDRRGTWHVVYRSRRD